MPKPYSGRLYIFGYICRCPSFKDVGASGRDRYRRIYEEAKRLRRRRYASQPLYVTKISFQGSHSHLLLGLIRITRHYVVEFSGDSELVWISLQVACFLLFYLVIIWFQCETVVFFNSIFLKHRLCFVSILSQLSNL